MWEWWARLAHLNQHILRMIQVIVSDFKGLDGGRDWD